jgi:hypothetical protein
MLGLLLNHDPGRTRIAVMGEYAIYLDDSGHPSNQPFVIVAGFVSTEQKWLAFEPDWKAALLRHGLGPVFHMTDFEYKYKGSKQRGSVLDDLISIINKHTELFFVCGVDVNGFRKANELYALEECMGAPYAIATRGVVHNVGEWVENYLNPKTDHYLVFVEDGTLHRGDMQEAFRRDRLPVPQSVPKEHPCVQPADLLSWEMLNSFKSSNNHRRSFRNLILTRPGLKGMFFEKQLFENCKTLKIPLRSALQPGMKIVWHNSPKRIRKRSIH